MVPSLGAYHGFLDSRLLQIGKLLKQGFPVAKLNSSLYLSHKWPQQCSVFRSGAFKFARLVPCCGVLYDFHVKSMFDSGHVFFMSFVFIFAYWCPTQFHVMQDTLSEHRGFLVGSCISFIGFLYNVLWIVVFPFVIFRLPCVLYVLLWFTASYYPFGIFKLFPLKHVMFSVTKIKKVST